MKLTEGQLRNIVKEATLRVLSEQMDELSWQLARKAQLKAAERAGDAHGDGDFAEYARRDRQKGRFKDYADDMINKQYGFANTEDYHNTADFVRQCASYGREQAEDRFKAQLGDHEVPSDRKLRAYSQRKKDKEAFDAENY